ncbi:cytochrome P450 [Kitasatospora sp. NPDC004240]
MSLTNASQGSTTPTSASPDTSAATPTHSRSRRRTRTRLRSGTDAHPDPQHTDGDAGTVGDGSTPGDSTTPGGDSAPGGDTGDTGTTGTARTTATRTRTAPDVPPLAPGGAPGLGHVPALLRDPLGFLGSLARYGRVVRIRLGPRTVCVVTDAGLVHTLLVGLARNCPRGAVQDTLRTAFGDGLLMSEGRAHRDRRRTVQPAFAPDRMTEYLTVMHRVTEERIGRWRPGQVLDVAEEMNHLALEIVTRALFDARLGERDTLAFHRALPDLVKGQIVQSLYPHPAFGRLPLPVNRRFDAAVGTLNRVVDQAVGTGPGHPGHPANPGQPELPGHPRQGSNVAGDAGDAAPRGILPNLLRAAVDPATGRPLTEADVRSEAITMFGAGTETVSTTLTWLLDELLRHPRVEARILAELDEHLPPGTAPTPEALARLTYTHAVAQEVLRLHAPNAFLMRTAVREVRLGPYRIPAGTEILYSLTALHRDPALHPRPLHFDPERWLTDAPTATRTDAPNTGDTAPLSPTPPNPAGAGPGRHAFLSFGAGKHKCIGEAFARAELIVAVAAILRRWRPLPVPGAAAREVVWTTVQAQGLRIRLAPRTPPEPAAPITPTAPAARAVPPTRAAPRPGRAPGELNTSTERHITWALAHGLLTPAALPHYRSDALQELIGHSYPRATGAELDLLMDVLGWFTVLDDRFDGPTGRCLTEARATVDPLLATLHPAGGKADDEADGRTGAEAHNRRSGTPTTPDGLLGAWQDLWPRQCAPMPPAWRRRAALEWRACLDTFAAEAAHRARGTVPGLTETIRLRRHASCLYPFMNILERVYGSEAPARLLAEPALRLLRAHTADAATLLNDLYSLDREERQPTTPFNTVVALQRARGCSRRRAVAAVRARVGRLREESEDLRRELLRDHPAGSWYLDGTRELVDGVQAWCSTTPRYHVKEGSIT